MKILYIRPSSVKGYLKIGIGKGEGREELFVSEREYSDLGEPRASDGVDSELYEAIKGADMLYRAKKKALGILKFGDNSEKMLYIKLCRAGIDNKTAGRVASEMVGRGYVDDKRQLARLIKSLVTVNNFGPSQIYPRLIAKGYKRGDIESVMDELLSLDEIDFDEAKRRLLERKLPEGATDSDVKKILYKNGFSVC